jgi:hypothetical protein
MVAGDPGRGRSSTASCRMQEQAEFEFSLNRLCFQIGTVLFHTAGWNIEVCMNDTGLFS